ncbi:uncharacterized protein LOC141849088 [Brevipalpus obovatus]|uniref:uncharacterized protein LOC141849088 n=1 Tax=Brevipalpus obovatus TaxID=246614 RepID=UPI003D9FAA21
MPCRKAKLLGDVLISWTHISVLLLCAYLTLCTGYASSAPAMFSDGIRKSPSIDFYRDLRFTGFISHPGDTGWDDISDSSESRMKRSGIADQRLAEMEAKAALRELKGKPEVGFGQFDFDRIGKRKRREKITGFSY